MAGTVYLIPSILTENTTHVLPLYITETIKKCSVFFVEEERTTRRFFKSIWKEMVIDNYEWFSMKQADDDTAASFRKCIRESKTIGIVSEAGCPGIADPGQQLVDIAHQLNIVVHPLVGPNSILLALMASGMNGQQFRFSGYLPVDSIQRTRTIKELESESKQKNCTQIFIETPYRNNQLLEAILKTCLPQTKICIAVDLTGSTEMIKTKTVKEWKKDLPQLHKRPAIFLLYANY
jgi:16S rRNA (cytidine1402-2'-O)-methyltransferase